MQLSQPFEPILLVFWSSFDLVLVSSAFIAHLLSCGPDSLSESRKRGRVVATAEKTEQRLAVFLNAVFSGFYFNL